MDKSYLYTPALKSDALLKNDYGHCSVAVLDLEDSIHPTMKHDARCNIQHMDYAALRGYANLSLRINAINTLDGIKDIAMLGELFERIDCPFDSVFVPKVKHHRELLAYRSLFETMAPKMKVITIIETVEAVEDLDAIAAHSDALILGQADLVACLYAKNASYIADVRAKLCVYAAKYNILAIDTNSFEINDMALFEQQCMAAKAEGFLAKAAIHPKQIETINRVFDINDEQQQSFKQVIDIYDRSVNGFAIKDGRIIAPPFVAKANKMLDLIAHNK